MPAQDTYILDSLELNLFFLRIMKEHALFLQLNFTPKDKPFADAAQNLRTRLDGLLRRTIAMAKGHISPAVMSSGELFTRYTEEAERQTQYFTGVPIDGSLTVEEYDAGGDAAPPETMLPSADDLNNNAAELTEELLRLKRSVFENVTACGMFTGLYPLQISHVMREAEEYLSLLEKLRMRRLDLGPEELAAGEAFWNDIMREHAEFIDGSLDPTEKAQKAKAEAFAAEFERLTRQAQAAKNALRGLPDVTGRSLAATRRISDFKAQCAQGILSCGIRSVIIPLLADHVLREANFYLRILKETMG